MVCQHIIVSGLVQGVGYRYYTADQARQLGLVGFARNLSDGRVEVVAKGEQEAVNQLVEYLYHASPFAKVSSVQIVDSDYGWQGNSFSTY